MRQFISSLVGPLVLTFALGASIGCSGSAPADMAATPDDLAVSDLVMPPDLAPPPACQQLNLPVLPFDVVGPYGVTRDQRADDFTLTDQNGPWSLEQRWSGCESYVFLTDTTPVSPLDKTSLWASDLDALLSTSSSNGADNVHYFFISNRPGTDAAAKSIMLLQGQLKAALAQFPDGDKPGQKGWWSAHLHFVQGSASQLNNWVGDALRKQAIGFTGFAIDRFQRLRALGNFADVQRFDMSLQAAGQWPWQNNLAYAAYPAIYFNYEAARQKAIDAEQAKAVLTVFDNEMIQGTKEKDVTFPDAATMATFDRFEIDLTMNCPSAATPEEANGNCGAWDYLAGLSFAVPSQDSGRDGGISGPDGGAPPVQWAEAARFITTYHRAGRFTVDATHFLPYLAAGGKQHLSLNVANSYVTTLVFRLWNSNSGLHPTHAEWLYGGGGFDPNYDPAHKTPVLVPIPAGAKKVELRAIITGHGGATKYNCAEFCDHQHLFTINGKTYTKDFPEAGANGDDEGCLKKINQGAIPNQSGTWWFGRGGWCPGMQVDPWVVDVTPDVTPGKTATISYQGLFMNKPPTQGYGNIVMSSWLVIWE